MPNYDLPTSASIKGKEWTIRSDYRAILDVLAVLGDSTTDATDRAIIAMEIFYPDFDSMPSFDFEAAYGEMVKFINCGTEKHEKARRPKVMDWQQDFPIIIGPVNKVLGFEARAVDYLHWWTFMSAYSEIGDCLFAQVVSIRKKRAAGKKLDKSDEKFFRDNADLVIMQVKETSEEKQLLDEWMKGGVADGS